MKIRRAVLADGPAYLDLVRALAEFEKLTPPDEAACKRLVGDAFADPPRYELWVAELEPGELVAYAATFMTYSTLLARPTLFLEDIFVHPQARRRKVATMMMETLRNIALERGCGRMDWMVLDWNTDAQAFYNRLGAKPMREWLLTRMEL